MEGMGTEVIPSTPGERRTLLERVREEARAEVEARLAEALEARAKEAEARAKEAEARAEAEARVRELEALVRALRATKDDGKG